MKRLSERYKVQDVRRCDCGSAAFFDWGAKMLTDAQYPHPRYKDFTAGESLLICVGCHRPIVLDGGEMYDASEFVSQKQMDGLIQYGLSKEHAAPIRAMDP